MLLSTISRRGGHKTRDLLVDKHNCRHIQIEPCNKIYIIYKKIPHSAIRRLCQKPFVAYFSFNLASRNAGCFPFGAFTNLWLDRIIIWHFRNPIDPTYANARLCCALFLAPNSSGCAVAFKIFVVQIKGWSKGVGIKTIVRVAKRIGIAASVKVIVVWSCWVPWIFAIQAPFVWPIDIIRWSKGVGINATVRVAKRIAIDASVGIIEVWSCWVPRVPAYVRVSRLRASWENCHYCSCYAQEFHCAFVCLVFCLWVLNFGQS